VLSAQSGERGRIAEGLGRDLRRRSEASGDGQGYSVEEIAARNRHVGIRGIADFDRQSNGQMMVPLHAFIKNSDKTPPASMRPMTCPLRPCHNAFPPSARKQSAAML
jgi:hypothetical protein